MAEIYFLRQDKVSPVKAGHTLVIRKTISVGQVYSNYNANGTLVVDKAGKRYYLGTEWDYEFGTPVEWPVQAGDVWESNGTEYSAIRRNGEITLEPVDNDSVMPVLSQEGMDKFLKSNPVLVFRRK